MRGLARLSRVGGGAAAAAAAKRGYLGSA